VHCGLGVLVLVLLIFVEGHTSNASALGGIAAWFGWLGLGTLGLVRFAPRTIEPPRFRYLGHFLLSRDFRRVVVAIQN